MEILFQVYQVVGCCVFIIHSNCGFDNLALKKPAWQTTDYYPDKCFASAAVDGDKRQTLESGSCAIIKGTSESAEWRVQLVNISSIYNIKIYFRNEVSIWRLAGFSLYVSNTTNKDDGYLCFHEIQTSANPPPYIMNIDCKQHARYVIYYNERYGIGTTLPSYYETLFNELCEVEVYGCADPRYFGEDCDQACPQNCKSQYCDIVNGNCRSCINGYQGNTCKQKCLDHFYGENCKSQCGNCFNKAPCNHIRGVCPSPQGCAAGWKGAKCDSKCASGKYGLGCSNICSVNCNGNTCNNVNGACTFGCKAGWHGLNCSKVCDDFFYGDNCSLPCGKCSNDEKCNNINGNCPNECAAGWKGDKCTLICTHGTYGPGCKQLCSVNCDSSYFCNRVDGSCTNGCKPGWQGSRCDKVCDELTYGTNCSLQCGKCSNGGKCNIINGKCESRCETGWQGEQCKSECDPGSFGLGCIHNCSKNCYGCAIGVCDHVNGNCKDGCIHGWHGTHCDQEGGESCEGKSKDAASSRNLLIVSITGWVMNGILTVSFIIYLILLRLRKSHKPREKDKEYDDINMDQQQDNYTYSTMD